MTSRTVCVLLVLLGLTACGGPDRPLPAGAEVVATFSIVARDPDTGDLGIAVQSRFLGVGAVVPWARADIGAVATQAFANTTFGPRGLELLDDGASAEEATAALLATDAGRARRQLGIVDARGRASAFTGLKCMDWAGHVVGDGYCCQGNILAGEAVVQAMAKAFEEVAGPFPERLVAALEAGQAKGGDKRGRQSAALLVVRRGGGFAGLNDRFIDLHVEDHPTPIQELARVLALHRQVFRGGRIPVTPEGLVREPRFGGETPRSTFEAWRREALAGGGPADLRDVLRLGQYVGTRLDGDRRATLFVWVPGADDLRQVPLDRAEDGGWAPRQGR